MGQPRVHSAVPARSRPRSGKTVTRSRFGGSGRGRRPGSGPHRPGGRTSTGAAPPPAGRPRARGPRRVPVATRRAYDRLTHVLEMATKARHPSRGPVPERGVLMSLEEIDLIDGRNFVAGRAPPLVRRAPPGGAGLLAPRGGRPPGRLLGHHPLRRLRARQPGLGALLLGPPRPRSSTRWTTTSWPSSS